jgi:hypothetical protein
MQEFPLEIDSPQEFRTCGSDDIRASEGAALNHKVSDLSIVDKHHTLESVENCLRNVVHVARRTLEEVGHDNRNLARDHRARLRPKLAGGSLHPSLPLISTASAARLGRGRYAFNEELEEEHSQALS